MDIFTLSGTLVDAVGTNIIKSLTFLAAVGGLGMALVQVFKELSPVRQIFNRGFLLTWFLERLGTAPPHVTRNLGWVRRSDAQFDGSVDTAFKQAVELAAGGHQIALLDLSVEQLCGQLNSAAQIALEYPTRYDAFFAVLVAGANPNDIAVVKNGNPQSIDFPMTGIRSPTVADPERAKQQYLEARARIQQFAQRSIDALHIRLGARWKWWLQIASFVFCAAITYAAFALKDGGKWRWPTEFSANELFYLTLSCIIGGLLAPIARDVVAAVQGARK